MIYPSGDADIGGQTKPGGECGETEGAREWKLIRRGDRSLPRPKNQRGLHSPPVDAIYYCRMNTRENFLANVL